MPKASKRKKEKKADFQKTKLKLGKGKQVANNATDTSFKAKTIALPQQSINTDKSGKLVNSRNLTVADLALQLRHYSPNVRRDAIAGIREILTLHPGLMRSSAAQLVPELSRCIGDDDAAVRKQLHSLFAWMLPQIPSQLLGPFHNTLLLFTTSALSHIYPEVRVDAIRVLDVCLDVLPQAATTGWQNAVFKMIAAAASTSTTASSSTAAGTSSASHQPHGERIMNCYLNLLGITQRSSATASTTATDLAPGAKLLILKSLRSFLAYALPSTTRDDPEQTGEVDCPTWFFRSAFASPAEFEYFEKLLRRHTTTIRPPLVSVVSTKTKAVQKTPAAVRVEASYSDWMSSDCTDSSLMDLDRTAGKCVQTADVFASLQTALASAPSSGTLDSSPTSDRHSQSAASLVLYTLLDPILLASFLDTAPSAFRPDMDLSHQPRAQTAGMSTPLQLISEIIALMLALWRASVVPSVQARTCLANMLGHVSVYFPLSHHSGSSGLSAKAKASVVQMDLAYAELSALLALNNAKSPKTKSKFNVEAQIASISTFIAELLSVPVTESGTVSLESVESSAAASVLDPKTFRALLPTLWFLLGTDHGTLLDSLLDTYTAHAAQHRVKPVLFEFLARAFLLSKLRAQTPFSADESQRILESLSSTLPRCLWEATTRGAFAFAGMQLEFLQFLLLLPSPTGLLPYDKLGPFYWVRLPARNVSSPGAFSKLPPALRKLAMDNTQLLHGLDAKLDKAMSNARNSIDGVA